MPDRNREWRARLRDDPLPWLLDEANPAVRHLALRSIAVSIACDVPAERRSGGVLVSFK